MVCRNDLHQRHWLRVWASVLAIVLVGLTSGFVSAELNAVKEVSNLTASQRAAQSEQHCDVLARQGDRNAIKAIQLISSMRLYKNDPKRKQLQREFDYLNERAKQDENAVSEQEFSRIFEQLTLDAKRYKKISSAGNYALRWCSRRYITSKGNR